MNSKEIQPMTESTKKDLRTVRSEPASVQIGKNGLTSELIDELISRLKRNGLLKIRFLKNSPFETRDAAFSELKKHLSENVDILETRGWTVILQKKK